MVPKVVVQLVEELKEIMSISEICDHLGVSRSSYYRWKKNSKIETKKEVRDRKSVSYVNFINIDMDTVKLLAFMEKQLVKRLCEK